MEKLARTLNLSEPGFAGVLDWILALRAEIGIPNSLAEIGIDDARVEQVGQMAELDPSAGTNPIPFDAAGYREIFVRACEGALVL
jgi:alcohol dehydrogenase class IV